MTDSIFSQGLIAELDAEATSTRNCLKETDAKFFPFKPHPRSMEMGYLAQLVAEIPLWITHTIRNSDLDIMKFEHKKTDNAGDLVKNFEENVAEAKATLGQVKDGDLEAKFSLKNNGEVVLTSSKRESIESMINHMVHHRGQLTVYMRLNDIPVPSIYGPSADSRNS